MKNLFAIAVSLIVLFVFIFQQTETRIPDLFSKPTPVDPDWSSIAAWPDVEINDVEAQPDPNRRITAIVLDDSGSMGADMTAAKLAVITALDAMSEDDRVAVLALNAGMILPFAHVRDARDTLPNLLRPVRSDGSTPLTRAIKTAQTALEEEAALSRGFGTFRLIVTTDGQANYNEALNEAVEDLAERTPIQVTTIGIGLTGRHVLRRSDLGSFVDVSNVDGLQVALQAAVAENTQFAAITSFDEKEN